MSEIDQNSAWGAFRLRGWKARWLPVCRRIRGRRLALWLRKPLKSCLHGWVDVEVWGLKLRLAARGNLSEQRLLLTPGSLDVREREALAAEVANGEVFVDIGANAGVYTFWMACRPGGGVRVEAFEPDPELCRRLEANLRRNDLGNVTLHPCALGEREGTAFLHRVPGNLGESRVMETPGAERVEVRVRRLAEVLHDGGVEKVAALKIDVEGHEVDVLGPYFAATGRAERPRLIVCEVPRRLKTVSDLPVGRLLLDAGYTLSARTRMNGIFRRER